ncbi:MAG: RnfABCDGE type electron transport complex subunit G [Pseudomonadota bacterium]
MDLDSLRGKLSYQGLLLGGTALLTSAALALASRATGPDIEKAAAEDLKQSLTQVLPGHYENNLLEDTLEMPGPGGKPITIYRARRAGQVAAVVFPVSGRGYAGAIDCIMSVDREGRIIGVRVLKHTETPGLGDKIEPAKGDWIHSFEGKYLGDPTPDKFAVKKDGGVFDQFAGATITPRAVVKAVKGGLDFFQQEQAVLLDAQTQAVARKETP